MPLFGSSFPLDNAGFIVTVACPNRGSYDALMRALNNITPEAYEPGPPPPLTLHAESLAVAAGEPATGGGASSQTCTCPSGDGSLRWPCPSHPPELADPLEPRLAGIADEEPPLRACATGGCGDE